MFLRIHIPKITRKCRLVVGCLQGDLTMGVYPLQTRDRTGLYSTLPVVISLLLYATFVRFSLCSLPSSTVVNIM